MAKKFKIFVRGRNYLLNQQGEAARKFGFYVTVFTEARNQEEAEALAVDLLKNDSKLTTVSQNSESDPPSLSIESTAEIVTFDGCTIPRTGLALFAEESS